MLNDEELKRLTDLLTKTEARTGEEEVELASLKVKATASDDENKPAAPPTIPLPTGMDEANAQIKVLKEMFQQQRDELAQLRAENREAQATVALLKAGQDAIASGVVKTLFRHCNDCGRKLRQGEEFCPAHPNEHVNHVGLHPTTGVMMLAKQTRRGR